jgi:hypothetical protein
VNSSPTWPLKSLSLSRCNEHLDADDETVEGADTNHALAAAGASLRYPGADSNGITSERPPK